MTRWTITPLVKAMPKLKNPVMVEGLPGIGNVGKVAADFIVEELKAEKIYDIFSYSMPNSVFVNEDNIAELPGIGIYYKQGTKDLLFLAGDTQPIDEESSYAFSDVVLDIFTKFKCSELITLGGIGLPNIPKTPKVYCTGNSKQTIKKYAEGEEVGTNLYGIVGPIIGVSGLLLGMAKRRNISAVALLAETYANPMYLGVRSAREIVKILNNKLQLGIDMKALDKEVREIEEEISKSKEILASKALRKLHGKLRNDISYIG
ncbi:PAC2 family protein [Candidatus Woesearchaeota archaeon]|nr:PAC2 family protein [Candidatus Woesearchaeota archaeon]